MPSSKLRFFGLAVISSLVCLLVFQNCTPAVTPLPGGGDPGTLGDSPVIKTSSCNGQPYEGLTCSNQQAPPDGGSGEPSTNSSGMRAPPTDVSCESFAGHTLIAKAKRLDEGSRRFAVFSLRKGSQEIQAQSEYDPQNGTLKNVVEILGVVRVLRVLEFSDTRARIQLKNAAGALVVETLTCRRLR